MALRAAELVAHPELVPRTFDVAHSKAIHRQLFQDLYEWASEFGTVDIGKEGRDFARVEEFELYADRLLGQLRAANIFVGRDRAGVVEGLTFAIDGLNIHPFREGNGRTQRVLAEHIAERAGFVLDWREMDPTAQTQAMIRAYEGELQPLHRLLDPLIRALPSAGRTVDERATGAAPGARITPADLAELLGDVERRVAGLGHPDQAADFAANSVRDEQDARAMELAWRYEDPRPGGDEDRDDRTR